MKTNFFAHDLNVKKIGKIYVADGHKSSPKKGQKNSGFFMILPLIRCVTYV